MCEEHSIYNQSKPTSSNKGRKAKKRQKATNRIMDFSLIKKVLQETVPFGLREIIPSTMGEPLLYKDFKKLLKLIRKYGLKLNLTTNGTFPTLGANKWAELIMPVASDIKVSINGADKQIAENIMRGLNFEQQLANIQTLIKTRDNVREEGINHPTLTFQVTFMERNLPSLEDILHLGIQMDADRFKGHHVWVTNHAMEEESLKRHPAAIQKWNNTVDKLYSIAENHRLKNGASIQLDNIYKLKNRPNKYLTKLPNQIKSTPLLPTDLICPFLGREAWIAWDGTFNVCCAPDNLRRKFGSFGNVKTRHFLELWNSKSYSQLLTQWGNHKVCAQCNMRKPFSKSRRRSNG